MIVGIDLGSRDRSALVIWCGGRLVSGDTAWPDLGCDLDRLSLLEQIERAYEIHLSDDDRESIQTVGDLTALVARRAV